MDDIVSLAKKWILLPACKVSVQVDDEEPIQVGFKTPKEALEAHVKNFNLDRFGKVRVVEESSGGLTLAYALRWSETYRDWAMMAAGDSESKYSIPCTCIEGITVDLASPGFRARSVMAIANATGKGAPRTNVARSGLESTQEQEAMVVAIYQLYLRHIVNEIERLRRAERYSLTWAVNNAPPLCYAAIADRARALNEDALRMATHELPIFLIENEGRRTNVSFSDLKKTGSCWTVDSQLMWSSEQLVKETSGNSSISALVKVLDDAAVEMPSGIYLANLVRARNTVLDFDDEWEPIELIVREESRRTDIRWSVVGEVRNWLRVSRYLEKLRMVRSGRTRDIESYLEEMVRGGASYGYARAVRDLWLPRSNIQSSGLGPYAAITSSGRTFVSPNTAMGSFLLRQADAVEKGAEAISLVVFCAVFMGTINSSATSAASVTSARSRIGRVVADFGSEHMKDKDEFLEILAEKPLRVFDPVAWSVRKQDMQ